MLSELRSATRGLVRWRGGLAVAILTLAVGIGTTTSLYALVRVLLADLPGVPELDRVGRVYASSQELGVERGPVALNEFDSTLSKATSFAAVGAYAAAGVTIGTGQDLQPVIGGYASPAFFPAMGVAPAAGRVFTAADVTSSQPVAIVSQALYRRRFPDGHLDRATITVDGVERAVIGVMPPDFRYEFVGMTADLWMPLGRASRDTPPIVTVWGRLRDGVGWPAADAELRALARGRGQWTWRAIPIGEDVRRRAIGAYAGALGPALLVLLIACINVACLLLARGIEREKELSVRRALGATRRRVIRLLFAENLLLALVSGALGGAIAVVILRVLGTAFAVVQPSVAGRLAADVGLLPVAMATSVLACLLFGAVPALRLSTRDLAASLNGVPAAHKIEIAGYGGRDVIVFAEIASAVGLIVWTAMLHTLFAQIGGIRLAFPADQVVAMRVPAGNARDVAGRVAALPGVTHAAISSGMLGGGSRVRVEAPGARLAVMSRVPVGDGFFETLGVPLVRGRSFDASELHGGADVAILDESGARQLAPDGNAVGMRVRVSAGKTLEVIGVCRDAFDYGALSKAAAFAPPDIYVPYESPGTEAVVLARLSTDPRAALRAIAAAAQTAAGAKPARPVVLSDEMAMQERGAGGALLTRILGAFSILTLLLAASGVFAVIRQSVVQRTREFGIRLALGATPRGVFGLVMAREMKLIAAALVSGAVFTFSLTRMAFAELAALSATAPSVLGVLALSLGTAAVAVTLAAWKIVRLTPAEVLRRS